MNMNTHRGHACFQQLALSALLLLLPLFPSLPSSSFAEESFSFHDSHFHLTNYIQEGISAQDFLRIMGKRVGRSTLFGIPLQQQWSHRVTGSVAPTYYLDTDAKLYYYSFTDAAIAMAYRSLSPDEQKRFDPMITGFNPTDMYAADHIKRVLLAFPGVFSGIGEFTIHKEFVSSKITGDVASLLDPALDRILRFAAEAGLAVILHSDIHMPFAKPELAMTYVTQMKEVLRRHPNTTIIWAHTGLGRIIQPISSHAGILREIARDPTLKHVHFDISWDEVAKYVIDSEESLAISARLISDFPDRFLLGSDTVAPATPEKYYAAIDIYAPLLKLLSPEASEKLRLKNYERIFDAARKKVRAWEAKHT